MLTCGDCLFQCHVLGKWSPQNYAVKMSCWYFQQDRLPLHPNFNSWVTLTSPVFTMIRFDLHNNNTWCTGVFKHLNHAASWEVNSHCIAVSEHTLQLTVCLLICLNPGRQFRTFWSSSSTMVYNGAITGFKGYSEAMEGGSYTYKMSHFNRLSNQRNISFSRCKND